MTYLFIFLTVIAAIWKIFPPKKINYWYGYRTSTSMSSQANWNLANNYSSKIFLTTMLLLLAVTIFIEKRGYKEDLLLTVLLIFSIILMIVFTEIKLKSARGK